MDLDLTIRSAVRMRRLETVCVSGEWEGNGVGMQEGMGESRFEYHLGRSMGAPDIGCDI